MSNKLHFKLRIWRQSNPQAKGQLKEYSIDEVSPEQSFLEMLDTLNERLIKEGEDPVAFDSKVFAEPAVWSSMALRMDPRQLALHVNYV